MFRTSTTPLPAILSRILQRARMSAILKYSERAPALLIAPLFLPPRYPVPLPRQHHLLCSLPSTTIFTPRAWWSPIWKVQSRDFLKIVRHAALSWRRRGPTRPLLALRRRRPGRHHPATLRRLCSSSATFANVLVCTGSLSSRRVDQIRSPLRLHAQASDPHFWFVKQNHGLWKVYGQLS